MNSGKRKAILCGFLLLSLTALGQVKLPRLISDGMVLQRDVSLKIWGWAAPGEQVAIRFRDSVYLTTAGQSGEWTVNTPALEAGGPFSMQIDASNHISLRNILVGDVWVCSGQSNMELPMRRVSPIYPEEIENSENSFIRQFLVPQKYDFISAHSDLESGYWKQVNPQSVLDFSAVGYFFANELYSKYHIPIGLINTAVGGSPGESWLSEEAIRKFPVYFDELRRFKDSALIKRIELKDRTRIRDWYDQLRQKDTGFTDLQNPWYAKNLDTLHWGHMNVPGYWAGGPAGPINGVVWFRREVMVPASMVGQPARLILGRIVDADSVFINGVFVGATGYQYPPRRYNIPAGLLTEGKNLIVVRIINSSGRGGFVPDKPYEITTGKQTIDLKGNWLYRVGAKMESLAGETFIRWKPVGLYNAMISPLTNYRIKGVIWYQGESNADRSSDYGNLFRALIQNWRNNWNQGAFPFLYVQLANFMEAKEQPSKSNWALLRDAQLKTLSVPNTGMAVTIDIGEWNDIHPLNKKEVGIRLARWAQKLAYNEMKTVCSGPLYKSMITGRHKIILTFTNTGSGLAVKGRELSNFAIAGADKHFVWAKAKIRNNKVLVWNREVPDPVAVRYAWADNPVGANLLNKDGLPASPFRTDNWPF